MTSFDKRRAVVVGAGLGGLSSAIHLAARGWAVSVYEQQAHPGGKAGTETHGQYRFDTGPSLLTMPYVFDELFEAAGRNRNDYLTFNRLDPVCNYFWDDGTRFNAPGDPESFARAIEAALGENADNIRRYFRHAGRVHDIAADLFLRHSLHDPATYFSRSFFRSVFRLPGIDAIRSLAAAHRSFFAEPRVQQLFNRYATYNGSDPFQTPATMQIIPFIEYAHGGYSVEGGVHEVPRALEKLARELGVEISYKTTVTGICHEAHRSRRKVTGVMVSDPTSDSGSHPGSAEVPSPCGSSDRVSNNRAAGTGGAASSKDAAEFVPADIVVSNADISVTYPELLGDDDAPGLQRYRGLEPSSSGLVFYWGIDRSFPQLTVNNIFFSDSYPSEFESIFRQERSPDDPTVYVNITSKMTPGEAPPGCENWFVLVNAPSVAGQDWDAETRRVRAKVIKRVGAALGTDLESHIAVESVMTPADIEARTMSFRGALYGIASNSRFAAFARHANRSREYLGLYFCGGSAHPGGGMPLVVLSGKIAADLAHRDHHTKS